MAKKFTRFRDVEITGDLNVLGELAFEDCKLPGLDDITRPAKAAGSSYTKAELDAVVDALNGVLTLMGKPTS